MLAAGTIPALIAQATSSDKAHAKASSDSQAPARTATQFFTGLLFALGLHISGMAHPAKVTSFLSFPVWHAWDPSLALVILFGVVPNLITIQRKGFNAPPAFASVFALPMKTVRDVDARFVAGAVAFGVGWGLTDIHGCPHYGPAIYDEEDYNQDGFHRITGLNREGRTRREQRRINETEAEASEGEDDEEEAEDAHLNDRPEWEVLQHVEPNVRATFRALPQGDREMFLVNLQIQLFEERGITFADPEEDGEDGDGDGEEDDEHDHDLDDDRDQGAENNNEEGNDTVHIDNLEQEADVAAQDEDPLEVQTGADIDLETARIAMAEATQALESSTRGQFPTDPAEKEAAVRQYISDISEQNGASEIEEDVGERTANVTRLGEVVQTMLVDFASGGVPLDILRGAFDVLEADHPGNAEVASFQLLLSRIDQSLIFNRNNPQPDENHRPSSAASPDEDEPTSPMDVDSATEDGEEERPGWKGPPGGWPDNEEL
ncbi:hypothetical protein N0V95_002596 [Ascochyta clinopodiicola]|nr:hypothetical protein N0V95_002596 [Ascochyta clinopodiicola]